MIFLRQRNVNLPWSSSEPEKQQGPDSLVSFRPNSLLSFWFQMEDQPKACLQDRNEQPNHVGEEASFETKNQTKGAPFPVQIVGVFK